MFKRDHRSDTIAYLTGSVWPPRETPKLTGNPAHVVEGAPRVGLNYMRAPSVEFEASGIDPAESVCAACYSPEDHKLAAILPKTLARIVSDAIRVGRGTETLKNLAAMLEPYGVRRKQG